MIKWLSQNSKTPAAAALTEGVNVLSELKATSFFGRCPGLRKNGWEVVVVVVVAFYILFCSGPVWSPFLVLSLSLYPFVLAKLLSKTCEVLGWGAFA